MKTMLQNGGPLDVQGHIGEFAGKLLTSTAENVSALYLTSQLRRGPTVDPSIPAKQRKEEEDRRRREARESADREEAEKRRQDGIFFLWLPTPFSGGEITHWMCKQNERRRNNQSRTLPLKSSRWTRQ